MPRRGRLVRLRDACADLGCCPDTFWRKWHAVFTDPRPRAERRKGVSRRVYADELDVAIEQANKGPIAVLAFRKLMKRM